MPKININNYKGNDNPPVNKEKMKDIKKIKKMKNF